MKLGLFGTRKHPTATVQDKLYLLDNYFNLFLWPQLLGETLNNTTKFAHNNIDQFFSWLPHWVARYVINVPWAWSWLNNSCQSDFFLDLEMESWTHSRKCFEGCVSPLDGASNHQKIVTPSSQHCHNIITTESYIINIHQLWTWFLEPAPAVWLNNSPKAEGLQEVQCERHLGCEPFRGATWVIATSSHLVGNVGRA